MRFLSRTTFIWLMKDSETAEDALIDKQRTLYSLQHAYTTLSLMDEMGLRAMAKQMGISIAMLKQNHSKITATVATS
jgi:hypothetical protein